MYSKDFCYLCPYIQSVKSEFMSRIATVIKPLMPILSALYGFAIIYVTALPVAGDNPTFVDESLTWLMVVIASLFLAIAGVLSLKLKKKRNPKLMM